MIPLEGKGHAVPQLKAIRYGIYERRGLSCNSTSSIYQDFLKSENLLHKRGFVDSLLQTTVDHRLKDSGFSYPEILVRGQHTVLRTNKNQQDHLYDTKYLK